MTAIDSGASRPNILDIRRAESLALRRSGANWLRPGAKVMVVGDDRTDGSMKGRVGTIRKLCGSPFEDYCRVVFHPVGRQRVVRERMLQLTQIEPAEES